MKKLPSSIIGASGEHFVAAFLSALGLVVALPRGGVPSTDLIVTTETCSNAVSIQVKTGTLSYVKRIRKPEESHWLWDTSLKAIELSFESHWYAYVYLNKWPHSQGHPEVFFVPSPVVSKCLSKNLEEGQKRGFFWMYDNEANNFRGLAGVREILKYLKVENQLTN